MPLLLFCISKKRPHRDANKKIIFFRTFCRPTHPAVLCVEPISGSYCLWGGAPRSE